MRHAPDQGACAASATRLTQRRWLKAIDRLAQAQRQSSAPYALRSGDQVSMPQILTGYMLAHQPNRPLVTEQIPTHRVIVAERRDIYNGQHFSFDTVISNHYNLDVWISSQGSTRNNNRP
jgi:hypothetical protein